MVVAHDDPSTTTREDTVSDKITSTHQQVIAREERARARGEEHATCCSCHRRGCRGRQDGISSFDDVDRCDDRGGWCSVALDEFTGALGETLGKGSDGRVHGDGGFLLCNSSEKGTGVPRELLQLEDSFT